ncbi:MAG TPA: ATPase, T2SS/T4P/T4SS family [bacterium]|nr:ATPase, T2SS/T4P/T4SS family [bacterium]
MLEDKDLKPILVKAKIITAEEFSTYKKEATRKDLALIDYLLQNKIATEEMLYETLAKFYNLPFLNLKNETIRKDILEIIPEPIAATHQIVAFDQNDTELKIACLEPDDMETFEFIKKKIESELKLFLTTPSAMREILKQYHKGLDAEFAQITKEEEIKAKEKAGGDVNKLKELAADLPIIKIVDTLLEYAIFESASDIHIEPQEKNVIVRYRVDGILRDVMSLPKKSLPGIVARIKILANLKLDEHRTPQDGRFKIQTSDYKISFRVSIIPVFDGEKIVMRLLNESTQVLTLEQLGFQQQALEKIKANIIKPHGMVLVTGPTGSGKTTTLYTILNLLNKPGVNITTIEDPIEYHMARVNQSQVNPKIGYTFAAGLRAFLRQDPNIIMVGEIRDNETADIAINAAMTGHLVLSTLHTNDAATALPRLLDMKIEPFLIASTTNVIIAQRLVRKICKNCIVSYNLTAEAEKDLEKQFDLADLKKVMEKNGLIKTAKDSLTSLLFYKGKGCKQCDNTGYKGRIGIYEVLDIDQEIGEMIVKKASAEEINKQAKTKGMISIWQDGFIKAKNGITTIEEILRVTKE